MSDLKSLVERLAKAARLFLRNPPPTDVHRVPVAGERWRWAPAEAHLAPEARGFCFADVLQVRLGLVLYRLGPGSLFPCNAMPMPLFVSLYAPPSGPRTGDGDVIEAVDGCSASTTRTCADAIRSRFGITKEPT